MREKQKDFLQIMGIVAFSDGSKLAVKQSIDDFNDKLTAMSELGISTVFFSFTREDDDSRILIREDQIVGFSDK